VKKHTYWILGVEEKNPAITATKLAKKGVAGVVLRDSRFTAAYADAGLDVWLLSGCFSVNELLDEESTKCVDISGRYQTWFGSGCPNNPVLRERDLDSLRKLVATPSIKGILLDRCRFASPAAGLSAFLTCFDEHCQSKAKELGFDFDKIVKDVRFIYHMLKNKKNIREKRGLMWFKGPAGIVEWLMDHPGLLEWLRFKRACITEHLRSMAEVVHRAGLRCGVVTYTPSLAPLVGQSYVDITDFVDVFVPFMFRRFPQKPGEGCLTWEITNIPEELGIAGTSMESVVTSIMLSWTRMTGPVTERTIAGLRANGISPEAAAREVILARSLIGKNKELIPIVVLEDPLLQETANLMFSNTATGMCFQAHRENWEALLEKVMV